MPFVCLDKTKYRNTICGESDITRGFVTVLRVVVGGFPRNLNISLFDWRSGLAGERC